mgnify:CR=1 FL=1
MSKNSLNVIEETQRNTELNPKEEKITKKELAQAIFDRIWLQNPEKFIHNNSILEKEKQNLILLLITKYLDLREKKVVDIGCGAGILSRKLRDLGAEVYAVDVSQNALKELKKDEYDHITPLHDYVPNSLLPDDAYDLVVATNLIADLDPSEYRMFFSELARIVNSKGYVLCSTSIDINSEDALQLFADLAATEFEFMEWNFCYHRLNIKILKFFKAPLRFIKAWKDKKYRTKEISNRNYLYKFWFKINSRMPLVFLWYCLQYVTIPIVNYLEKNKFVATFLEKLSKFLWQESAISYAIFIGKRRSFTPQQLKEGHQEEMKHKKQLWE